jgi:hypothetical protein
MRQTDLRATVRSVSGDEIRDEQQSGRIVSASHRKLCNCAANEGVNANRRNYVPAFAAACIHAPGNLRVSSRGGASKPHFVKKVCQFVRIVCSRLGTPKCFLRFGRMTRTRKGWRDCRRAFLASFVRPELSNRRYLLVGTLGCTSCVATDFPLSSTPSNP